jgi:KinB signaling pathway activation protein
MWRWAALNLKRWLFLFWTTLVIGAISSVIVGMILQGTDQNFGFLGVEEVGFNLTTMILGGLMFSVLSQMGFFSYLTLNYIAMSIIRKKSLWITIQLGLIIITLFELGYIRFISYAEEGQSFISFYYLPIALLIVGIVIAFWKMRMTNSTAFVPTLLLMTVATTLEAVPGLQQNNMATTLFMTVPLFICNAWQILMLHRILKAKKS